jgi:hypothetical protein
VRSTYVELFSVSSTLCFYSTVFASRGETKANSEETAGIVGNSANILTLYLPSVKHTRWKLLWFIHRLCSWHCLCFSWQNRGKLRKTVAIVGKSAKIRMRNLLCAKHIHTETSLFHLLSGAHGTVFAFPGGTEKTSKLIDGIVGNPAEIWTGNLLYVKLTRWHLLSSFALSCLGRAFPWHSS